MLVGIDIGGTKTHVRVVDAAGNATDTIVATSSWQHEGFLADPRSVRALVALFADRLTEAGTESNLVALAVGAHGCDSPQQIAELDGALRSVFAGALGVYNDAQLIGPAANRPDAVALIAGTGAIAVGSDVAGKVITAGGHGWLLADPGSAPALAREGMRAILARFDHTGQTDQLGDRFLAAFSAQNVNELAYEFTRTASMQSWAALGPVVFDAADDGSTDARTVIDAASAELVELALGVLARGARASAVVAAGGVVTNQPRLELGIRQHLATARPGLDFEVLRTPPVDGAIELARILTRTPTAIA